MKSVRDFIDESAEFTSLDMRRLGKQLDMAKKAREGNTEHIDKVKARKAGVIYQDDQRYQDNKGIKWTEVKSRSDMTLISAALDGIIDSMTDDGIPIAKEEAEMYRSGNEDDFDVLRSRHKDTLDEILQFLGKYKTGRIKVYRGYILNQKDYIKYIKSSGRPTVELLNKIDNRTKEFNSFSVCPMIARGFTADAYNSRTLVPVVISAMVEPNDVYWAFTAYLMGRHRGCGEYELNINNLKQLENMQVIHDIDAECSRYAKQILDVKQIQAKLDATKNPKKVFDKVKPADSFDKAVLDCRLGGFHVFVKNNKMITPFGICISEIKENIYAIADTEYNEDTSEGNHWYIYKEGVGQIGKKYARINRFVKAIDSENIMVYNEDKSMQLVNCVTGKELFNFKAKDIQRAPGNIYSREPSVWHAEEYYVVKLPNNKYTVVNKRGACIIRLQLKLFDRIDFDLDTMTFDGITSNNGNRYTFIVKNGVALQQVG